MLLVIWRVVSGNVFFSKKGKKFSSYWAHDDLWLLLLWWLRVSCCTENQELSEIWYCMAGMVVAVKYVVTVLLFSLKIMTMRRFWPMRKCHCTISQQIGNVPSFWSGPRTAARTSCGRGWWITRWIALPPPCPVSVTAHQVPYSKPWLQTNPLALEILIRSLGVWGRIYRALEKREVNANPVLQTQCSRGVIRHAIISVWIKLEWVTEVLNETSILGKKFFIVCRV